MQDKTIDRRLSNRFHNEQREVQKNTKFTRQNLMQLKQRALRQGLWFKALSRIERAIFSLTTKCVEFPSSPRLIVILEQIVQKLSTVSGVSFSQMIEKMGSPLAVRIALIAESWGIRDALSWKKDIAFIRYLGLRSL